MANSQSLTVRLNDKSYVPIVRAKQGDTGRLLDIYVDGTIVLDGLSAVIFSRHPGSNIVTSDCLNKGLYFQANLANILYEAGSFDCELKIYNGEDVITSFNFSLIVESTIDRLATDEEVTFVAGLQADLERWKQSADGRYASSEALSALNGRFPNISDVTNYTNKDLNALYDVGLYFANTTALKYDDYHFPEHYNGLILNLPVKNDGIYRQIFFVASAGGETHYYTRQTRSDGTTPPTEWKRIVNFDEVLGSIAQIKTFVDLDTFTTPGVFYCTLDGSVAKPGSTNNGILIVVKLGNGNAIRQMFFEYGTPGTNDSEIYTRQLPLNSSGAVTRLTSWIRIATNLDIERLVSRDLTEVTDANKVTDTGFYYFTRSNAGADNHFPVSTGGYLTVIKYNDHHVIQYCESVTSTTHARSLIYHRKRYDYTSEGITYNTWSDWEPIFDDYNWMLKQSTVIEDANNATDSGFYVVSEPAASGTNHTPHDAKCFLIVVSNPSQTNILQYCTTYTFTSTNAQTTYIRKKLSTGWAEWIPVFDYNEYVSKYTSELSNANSATATGFYTLSKNATNNPFGSESAYLFCIASSDSIYIQFCFQRGTGTDDLVLIRRHTSSGFSEWFSITGSYISAIPISLGSDDDLNKVTISGNYAITTSTPKNCPLTSYGTMQVINANSAIVQVVHPHSNSNYDVYVRKSDKGSWGSWFKFTGTAVS